MNMSMDLSLLRLKNSLQQPGCPVCWIEGQSARQYIKYLLAEHVGDVETRRHFIASLGFCPAHTYLLAKTEVDKYSDAKGVSILYERLSQVVEERLRAWQKQVAISQSNRSLISRLIHRLSAPGKQPGILSIQAKCRICQVSERGARDALKALFEEIERPNDELAGYYESSPGLCLPHLRTGLNLFSKAHPLATVFIIGDTLQRLSLRRKRMNEYIRKQGWDSRDETISDPEQHAWEETLDFFTGYFPSSSEPKSEQKEKIEDVEWFDRD